MLVRHDPGPAGLASREACTGYRRRGSFHKMANLSALPDVVLVGMPCLSQAEWGGGAPSFSAVSSQERPACPTCPATTNRRRGRRTERARNTSRARLGRFFGATALGTVVPGLGLTLTGRRRSGVTLIVLFLGGLAALTVLLVRNGVVRTALRARRPAQRARRGQRRGGRRGRDLVRLHRLDREGRPARAPEPGPALGDVGLHGPDVPARAGADRAGGALRHHPARRHRQPVHHRQARRAERRRR